MGISRKILKGYIWQKPYKSYPFINKLVRMVKKNLKNKSYRGISVYGYFCIFQSLTNHKMMALTKEWKDKLAEESKA